MFHFSQKTLFDCLDLQQNSQNYLSEEFQQQKDEFLQIKPKNIDQEYELQSQKIKVIQLAQTNQVQNQKAQPSIFLSLSQKMQTPLIQYQYHLQSTRQSSTIICNPVKELRRFKIHKQNHLQTKNIGKHLKSITFKFLNILYETNSLDHQQSSILKNFKKSNGGLKDFRILFEDEKISQKCEQFYRSRDFVVMIMRQKKMDVFSKVMMIKHMARLTSITYKSFKTWVKNQWNEGQKDYC